MRKWTRDRFMWGRAVRQVAGMSPCAKMLAWALSEQFADNETGQCHPSKAALADALGVSDSSVKRAIRELESGDWIAVERGVGRGRVSTYQLTFPGDSAVGKGVNVEAFRPRQKGSGLSGKGVTADPAYRREPSMNPLSAHTRANHVDQGGGAEAETPRAASRHAVPPTRLASPLERPARAGAAPRRPGVPCEIITTWTHERRVAEWNAWLAARGWPSLDALRDWREDGRGRQYRVPLERPPFPDRPDDLARTLAFFERLGLREPMQGDEDGMRRGAAR